MPLQTAPFLRLEMKGLFWRVFAWYLGSTAVLLAGALGVMRLTDPDFSTSSSVSVSRDAIQTQGESAIRAWERGGAESLRAAFARNTYPRFLFDSEGHELARAKVTPHLAQLVARTQSSEAVELDFFAPQTFAAIQLKSHGKTYVFARELTRSRRFPLMASPLPGWVRLGLGFFTALFICILFAHYVTSPLRRLRAVTREFAGGQLQVRIGSARPFHRGDEFTDLARDFDNMAGRIENLILTQQRMLGDISHELRSPLTRLLLALEIARRKVGDHAQEPLNRIEQEADRINVLIGQILRSVKAELAAPGLKKLFDLSNLMTEICQDADFEATARSRRVIVLRNEVNLVNGDRELVRSAIENIVRNAIRYTGENTEITIEQKRVSNSHATISVRDRGPGVPEADLPHLFEPFYRVNDARDRDSGGAGLGLAITRHVVSVHGGSVRAANLAEGGFEINVELPIAVPDSTNRGGMKFRLS